MKRIAGRVLNLKFVVRSSAVRKGFMDFMLLHVMKLKLNRIVAVQECDARMMIKVPVPVTKK